MPLIPPPRPRVPAPPVLAALLALAAGAASAGAHAAPSLEALLARAAAVTPAITTPAGRALIINPAPLPDPAPTDPFFTPACRFTLPPDPLAHAEADPTPAPLVTTDAARRSYTTTFSQPPGCEWNNPRHALSPSGEAFLGPYSNETAALSITDLPRHSHLIIAADVIVAGDWPGNTAPPSAFRINFANGDEVFATTFATPGGAAPRSQSYPDRGTLSQSLPGAGAIAQDALGFTDPAVGTLPNHIYRLCFIVRHSAPAEVINFSAAGLPRITPSVADASEDSAPPPDVNAAFWGLDNVSITTADLSGGGGWGASGPEPDIALAALGAETVGDTSGARRSLSPLGNNPVISPLNPGPPGGGGDGGGGGGSGTPPPFVTPTPGAAALLGLGGLVLSRRVRRA